MKMVCRYLCKGGIVVRKVQKFLCCLSLSIGTKIIICYSTALFVFETGVYILRISTVKNGNADCNFLPFLNDHLCDIFNGNINAFSIILIGLNTLFNLYICITGLYSWLKKFSIRSLERFFYAYFIVTNFELINSIILHVVKSDSLLRISIELVIRSIIAFYILSIVYSFLLKTESEYRIERRNSSLAFQEQALRLCSSSSVN